MRWTRLARGFELLSLALVVWGGGAFVWNLGRMQLATFYGPLAFAVSLVLWAYVSSVVLVFGAAMAPGAPARR